MHKGNTSPEKKPNVIRAADAMRLLTFGWYFAACLGIGLAGGWGVDRWLGTKPGFLLGGLVLGSIVGFYGMFKMLFPIYKGSENSPDSRGTKG